MTTATATTNASGPIDNADIEEWKNRFNEVLAKPKEHIDSKSPATSQSWTNSLFGCFSPIDLCCMTWCLPCVTFGKTHHRIRKNGSMEGYEPINTSVRPFSLSLLSLPLTTSIVPHVLRLHLRRPPLDPPFYAARRHPQQVQPPGQLPRRPRHRMLLRMLRPRPAGEGVGAARGPPPRRWRRRCPAVPVCRGHDLWCACCLD